MSDNLAIVPPPRDFLESKGFEIPEDLTLRYYTPEDYRIVAAWWGVRHSEALPVNALPPLSVLVLRSGEPVGVLGAYEAIGSPVAFLEWPVTAPGLDLKESRRVMAFAVAAVCFLAGKRYDANGGYSVFRVTTPHLGIVRFLKQLGFVAEATVCHSLTLNFNHK